MDRESLSMEVAGCGPCTRAVTGALRGVHGVEIEGVEIGSAVPRVDLDRLSYERIRRAVGKADYTVREQGRES